MLIADTVILRSHGLHIKQGLGQEFFIHLFGADSYGCFANIVLRFRRLWSAMDRVLSCVANFTRIVRATLLHSLYYRPINRIVSTSL